MSLDPCDEPIQKLITAVKAATRAPSTMLTMSVFPGAILNTEGTAKISRDNANIRVTTTETTGAPHRIGSLLAESVVIVARAD